MTVMLTSIDVTYQNMAYQYTKKGFSYTVLNVTVKTKEKVYIFLCCIFSLCLNKFATFFVKSLAIPCQYVVSVTTYTAARHNVAQLGEKVFVFVCSVIT